ncbi:DUF3243 family protein, partial [Bacillus paralicheniformis]|uniref:DUF3243 family protein n=1 Tax=Bacillus paralicheniformis TaxID=1648923 RepID=UPI002899BF48
MAVGTYNILFCTYYLCKGGGNMTILENWQKWTSFLGQNVMQAESSGMPKIMIQTA